MGTRKIVVVSYASYTENINSNFGKVFIYPRRTLYCLQKSIIKLMKTLEGAKFQDWEHEIYLVGIVSFLQRHERDFPFFVTLLLSHP